MKIYLSFIFLFLVVHHPLRSSTDVCMLIQAQKNHVQPSGKTIASRFIPLSGFERVKVDESSFAYYLRNLPLKEHGARVKYFDGREKSYFQIYDAVVNLPIGTKDLHQCADAIMHVRARYLYEQKRKNEIQFTFTNGFVASYAKWMEGNRIIVNGNNVQWKKTTSPADNEQIFWKYLKTVFTYAGTLSLSKELKPKEITNLQIGDVWIQGGSPGHAVIVVDMVQRKTDGKKLFLLAQSYMPAQEIHILKNPLVSNLSPWYESDFPQTLQTPEWTFKKDDLKGF
ncbi:MAG: DUF4846 domain-containing protein [Cyclobacteriaceae bacterium]|nr:DUF4846 domain-containing protein [Cytophagales bacterium]MCZ8328388.1 DUF4846 domain-containing protein [Cyclobacteriaceae bacterium]